MDLTKKDSYLDWAYKVRTSTFGRAYAIYYNIYHIHTACLAVVYHIHTTYSAVSYICTAHLATIYHIRTVRLAAVYHIRTAYSATVYYIHTAHIAHSAIYYICAASAGASRYSITSFIYP